MRDSAHLDPLHGVVAEQRFHAREDERARPPDLAGPLRARRLDEESAGLELDGRGARDGRPDGVVLARYLILAGVIRFAVEFLRINAPVLGPLTLAQLWSMALIATGVAIATAYRRRG